MSTPGGLDVWELIHALEQRPAPALESVRLTLTTAAHCDDPVLDWPCAVALWAVLLPVTGTVELDLSDAGTADIEGVARAAVPVKMIV